MTSPRKMENGSVKNEERGSCAVGVLVVSATCEGPSLLFADEFVEILKEADQDDEQRASEANEEEPGEHSHSGAGKNDHRGIVNQAGRNMARAA